MINKYIIVILFFIYNTVFTQLPNFFYLDGYKDLKFGNSIECVENKITNYNINVYASFYESYKLKNNSIVNIYKNDNEKLAYYLYFFNDELYRIDIANHIGYVYNNTTFYNPITPADIENIKEKLIFKYGSITDKEIKYYSYYRKNFEEYTIWWASDLASVSINIKPDLNTLNNIVKLYLYKISFYDNIRMKKYSLKNNN